MNAEQERILAEAVLRTRRWAFREAFPEILRAVREIVDGDACAEAERRTGAERMIRDYRALLVQWPQLPAA